MNLISFSKLGVNREAPRLWIESNRLPSLGFAVGTGFTVERSETRVVLKPSVLGANHVSSRAAAGGRRAIIDIANDGLLSGLARYSEVRVSSCFNRIIVEPSRRAFAIHQSRMATAPYKVLELFAGGGTMTTAIDCHPEFTVVGGVEIEADFADEWQAKHPNADMIQADVRSVDPSELPEFDVLVAGIPCTSHSNMGRAKKSLAGKPELGDTGDLFIPVIGIIADRMPAAVVVENVPSFGTSLAGELLTAHLRRLGYHVSASVIEPHEQWGEIQDRRRWLMVATLERPFELQVPAPSQPHTLAAYLDPVDDVADKADAERIARTIEGLHRHNARHKALGHGFALTTVNAESTKVPCIPKSYHKINTGPFVETPHGLRMLRQSEIERIQGCRLVTQHYATAVQILGQGVQTRVFQKVFGQLATHLTQ